jgi:hypothetical protein
MGQREQRGFDAQHFVFGSFRSFGFLPFLPTAGTVARTKGSLTFVHVRRTRAPGVFTAVRDRDLAQPVLLEVPHRRG